jgi:hypothetical protein
VAAGDARALLDLGETGLARALLLGALAVVPLPELRDLLARTLLARGEGGLARPVLEELARDPSREAWAETQLGLLAQEAGEGEAARRHFERAVAVDPADALARDRAVKARLAVAGAGAVVARPAAMDAMTRLWGQAAAGEDYDVEEEVGRGGAATLFRAVERASGRQVALKVFHPRGDPVLRRDRIVREAAVAARFQSPWVVPVLDVVPERDLVVMPYLEEGSLRTLLLGGPLPPAEALRVVADVARALEVIHREGVAHLDLKPSNVLMRGGLPVLTDFGAAAARQQGQAAGTRAYMAPEARVPGGDVDHRADMYALGVVLGECLTGQPVSEVGAWGSRTEGWARAMAHIVRRLTDESPARRLPDASLTARMCLEVAAAVPEG